MNTPINGNQEANLIPAGEATKMQQHAVEVPPAAPLHAAPKEEEAQEAAAAPMVKEAQSYTGEEQSRAPVGVLSSAGLTNFNKLNCCLMVTLDLSDNRFIEGQAKPLSKSKDIDGNVVNLYSPFRKAKEERGIAAGVFRPLLGRAFKVLSAINEANIVISGRQDQVAITLKNSVSAVRSEIDALFPKFEGGTTAVDGISVADVFRSTSWVNMSRPQIGESEGVAIAEHSGVVNFIVNSGSIYDDADRIKLIRQLETTLQLISAKYPSVPVLLGISFAGEDVEYGEIRDLFTMLLDEDGYDVFSVNKLLRSLTNAEESQGWIPQTQASIKRDLMPAGSDLIFVKVVGVEVEEEEDASESEE